MLWVRMFFTQICGARIGPMGYEAVEDIKPDNIRDLVEQYVSVDYRTRFSFERGKFQGLTGEDRRLAREKAKLIDEVLALDE